METKSALITGITGQDGSYLADLLLSKGYEVYGLVRRLSIPNVENIKHIIDNIHLVQGDMTDSFSLESAVKISNPDEVYNLAAQSFVGTSWSQPELTLNVNTLGCTRLLETLHHHKPTARFYQASSSEMFGKVQETPQKETTPFYPRSPYGVSKVASHYATVNYRESYKMFCCSGILFNHESPRRGIEFVTRKITRGAVEIWSGLKTHIYLGNLDAKRDWGFSGDYMRAAYLMLQQDHPSDYVIATNETHSVREFAEKAFALTGLNFQDHYKIDERFMRPAEVDALKGDYSKAKRFLKWEPKVKFEELIRMMIDNDLKDIQISDERGKTW